MAASISAYGGFRHAETHDVHGGGAHLAISGTGPRAQTRESKTTRTDCDRELSRERHSRLGLTSLARGPGSRAMQRE